MTFDPAAVSASSAKLGEEAATHDWSVWQLFTDEPLTRSRHICNNRFSWLFYSSLSLSEHMLRWVKECCCLPWMFLRVSDVLPSWSSGLCKVKVEERVRFYEYPPWVWSNVYSNPLSPSFPGPTDPLLLISIAQKCTQMDKIIEKRNTQRKPKWDVILTGVVMFFDLCSLL